jgi:hypothetical protein
MTSPLAHTQRSIHPVRQSSSRQSQLFLAFVLSCGVALLLAPAIAAIPPYIALEYLAVGSVCIAAALVAMLPGRVRDLVKLVESMRGARRR